MWYVVEKEKINDKDEENTIFRNTEYPKL